LGATTAFVKDVTPELASMLHIEDTCKEEEEEEEVDGKYRFSSNLKEEEEGASACEEEKDIYVNNSNTEVVFEDAV
jgi:hypothetical protein